jgi:hypothetical protein
MEKTGYHATNHFAAIVNSGLIKPSRMKCVYLFETVEAVLLYALRFGYDHICRATYDTSDVAGTWRPAYVDGAKVIRLKPKATARLVAFDLQKH